MEFEELQKVWDAQGTQSDYMINEQALQDTILSKKRQAYHITHVSELLSIIVYTGTGFFVLGANLSRAPRLISLYLLAAWMLGVGVAALIGRIRRIRNDRRFDLSIYGDIELAISLARYQVRLSRLMRWNMLPVAILILAGFWEGGKPVWIAAGTFLFFALTWYASGFEHNMYKKRKAELDHLRSKLISAH